MRKKTQVCGIMFSCKEAMGTLYAGDDIVTVLLLIRHGMNDWVKGKLAGWTPGVHLNEEGRQQAAALSERMQSLPLAAVYSSPLERAIETAETIARPHQHTVQIVEGIGEVRYGEWTGADIKELSKLDMWAGVQFYPSGTRFPGGETLGEVQMRAVAALDALRDQHPKAMIAAVGHADVIKLVTAYYLGMHIDLFQRLVIDTASLTAIAFERMGPRLLAFNDTGSLDHLRPKPEEANPPAEEASGQAAQPQAE
jgi:probable phosphoglycerate mutase